MRRAILLLAFLALGGSAPFLAQQAPPPSHPLLPGRLRSPGHVMPAPLSPAQASKIIFDATGIGSPLPLDKGWRVGVTTDPAAAAPGFDDSEWAVRDAQESIQEISGEDENAHSGDRRRFVWFRQHIRLAPNHGPVSLLIQLPVARNTSVPIGSAGFGVDVFANGRRIQPQGPHGDAPEHYQQISRIYDLNLPPSETSLTLVVRTLYIPLGYGAYTSFFAGRSLLLGHPEDLSRSLKLWFNGTLFERLPRLVDSALLLVLALFLLALYFAQKGHLEYLWLALYELVQAPIGFVELAGSSAWLDTLLYAALVLQLVMVSAYLFFEFLISFLSLRRRWYTQTLRYTAPILAGIGPTLLMVGHGSSIGVVLVIVALGSLLWTLGWMLFISITLIAATLRRNFEAGLLLIPLLLTLVGWLDPVLATSMGDWSGHPVRSPLVLQAGPIPIHPATIADFTGIFVIVLIIFFRFLRIHRNQERASSELAAARSVQELMIPQKKLETPGFEVESVYTPANEVGGDFFHVQPARDGGLLVVIGDVAGKGLKAAMNVSMLIGALRRSPERSPAKILASLNRVIVDSESYTTCQAVWFGADGEVVVANAGHLPPYLNSQEVALPGGLPLGALPDESYEEVRLYLHPGDRLLLYSDGVVEARRPSGELFGFDRVHNLSNQSAFYIADAAKAFGQEDDITVLTVRRLAQTAAA